ncbi:hypothetical protein N7G274_008163 [Stereocaulon virgatum]|uniref:Uncharacterized protein n=1 Tax=Stereocaulon virgatum TaxID=373712 RepID=A0ABR4A0W4_9LECA
MPVPPYAAVIPGGFYYTVAYAECVNLIDYSVAVIPVTEANHLIGLFDNDYQPLNIDDHDPEVHHGAPVGLQAVARQHEQEKGWALAKIVDTALKTAEYKIIEYSDD